MSYILLISCYLNIQQCDGVIHQSLIFDSYESCEIDIKRQEKRKPKTKYKHFCVRFQQAPEF